MNYIYVVKKTDSVYFRLLPIRQWPQGTSCTLAHNVNYIYYHIFYVYIIIQSTIYINNNISYIYIYIPTKKTHTHTLFKINISVLFRSYMYLFNIFA